MSPLGFSALIVALCSKGTDKSPSEWFLLIWGVKKMKKDQSVLFANLL